MEKRPLMVGCSWSLLTCLFPFLLGHLLFLLRVCIEIKIPQFHPFFPSIPLPIQPSFSFFLYIPKFYCRRRSEFSSYFLVFFFCYPIMSVSRWIRPEVFPLFAAVGVAVGICGMQLVRNICINPEVRVTKENRTAGILENFAEGEKYAEHGLRKFVRSKPPQIMPSVNGFFSDPDLPSSK